MTQKELLYIEDATRHEKTIISILHETIKLLSNDDLVSFLEKEEEKHCAMKEKLMDCLKENCNE